MHCGRMRLCGSLCCSAGGWLFTASLDNDFEAMKRRLLPCLLLSVYLSCSLWLYPEKPEAIREIHYLHEVEIVTPASLPCVYRDIRV